MKAPLNLELLRHLGKKRNRLSVGLTFVHCGRRRISVQVSLTVSCGQRFKTIPSLLLRKENCIVMDEESVRQPSWSPRYTTESRKPVAPVSKVNAAHQECCHRPAPPDLSSSLPIVHLAHPLRPFLKCVRGKKLVQMSVWHNFSHRSALSCTVPEQNADFTSFLPCLHFKKKKNVFSNFARLTSGAKPCGRWSQMHLRMEAELEG